MTEKEKIKFIEYLRLKTRLKNASLNGAALIFDGRYSDADTIASACVFNDNGYYMHESRNRNAENPDLISVNLGNEDPGLSDVREP